MKNENLWLIWIPLIILIVMIFPKSCGFKSPIDNLTDYKCAGFKTPFISGIEKSNNPQEWCSGLCIVNIKNTTQINGTINPQGPSYINDMRDSFVKTVPLLLLIILIIGIFRWLGSLKKI